MSATVPKIEVSTQYSDQTSGTVTLFTPSADGLFRVSLYAESLSGSIFATVEVGWTDDSGTNGSGSGLATIGSLSPGNASQISGFIRAKGGDNITLDFTVTGTPSWNLFATVESL